MSVCASNCQSQESRCVHIKTDIHYVTVRSPREIRNRIRNKVMVNDERRPNYRYQRRNIPDKSHCSTKKQKLRTLIGDDFGVFSGG